MELIKPSSPTPDHLRHHKLSSIDQLSSSLFMPLILFFTSPDPKTTNTQRCNLLKQSLAQTLTHFHTLAGRVRDNTFIDCNDEGVHFVEAHHVHTTTMAEFLQDPSPRDLNQLLAFEPQDANDLLAAFQSTYFDCGGMAVSFQMSHKVADGQSSFIFLKTWASIARDGDIFQHDNNNSTLLNLAAIFPPVNNIPLGHGSIARFAPSGAVVSKRFVFGSSNIAELKTWYTEESLKPTRIEALSAFIWTRYVESTGQTMNRRRRRRVSN
ncbi:unnamed protein product [Linum tenue]|uniref:Uncharacterized protein n=1 Tax=Linum tenue TaxID=586396 RepID=A0AAV0KIW2_9ROSI|nr:unnamed protein product [Linum tenue]